MIFEIGRTKRRFTGFPKVRSLLFATFIFDNLIGKRGGATTEINTSVLSAIVDSLLKSLASNCSDDFGSVED